MAGGEHGIAKSGGLGGAQPHVWIVLVRIELLSQRLHLLEPRAVRVVSSRVLHLATGTEDFSRISDGVYEHILDVILRNQFADWSLAYIVR